MPSACDATAETAAVQDPVGCPFSSYTSPEAEWSPPGLLAPPGLEGNISGASFGSLCESPAVNGNSNNSCKDDSSGSLLHPQLIRPHTDCSKDSNFQALGEDRETETCLDLTDDSTKAELKVLLEKISSELDKITEDFASTAASTPSDGLTPELGPEAENPSFPKVFVGAISKPKGNILVESMKKDVFTADPFTAETAMLKAVAACKDSFAAETLDMTTEAEAKRRGRANGLGIAIVFGARGSELAEKTSILAQANENSLFFQESTAELDGVPIAKLAEEWLHGKDESAYCEDCYTGEEWCASTGAGDPAMLNPYADDPSSWFSEDFVDFNADWYSGQHCEEEDSEGVVINGREWFSV